MKRGIAPFSSYNIVTADKMTGTEFQLFLNSEKIGRAILQKDKQKLTLSWIEIKNSFQHKGHGTYLLNYILDNFLPSDSTFFIIIRRQESLTFYY